MRFRLIEAERARHSVSQLCSVVVTGAGFRAWKRRPVSPRERRDRELRDLISKVFADSRETYGPPRIYAELVREHGMRPSRKRVARLMRQLGIVAVSRRGKRPLTTKRSAQAVAASDLGRRRFQASGRIGLWVADITYVPTWEGFLFLASVLNALERPAASAGRCETISRPSWSAMHPGWPSPAAGPRPGVIHHSDQGSQPGLNRSSQQCE
jgi:putative transposase